MLERLETLHKITDKHTLSPTSKYSFTQYFLSARPFSSNTNLKSHFTPKIPIPIPIYQQQESPPMSPTHSNMYSSQVNIIHKKNYKKTHFTPNVEFIKLDYFSPYDKPKELIFKHFLLKLEMH